MHMGTIERLLFSLIINAHWIALLVVLGAIAGVIWWIKK